MCILTVEWQQLFFIDLYLTGQSRRKKLHRMLFRGYYQLMTLLEFPCFNLWNFIFLFFQDGVHIFVHVHYRFCNAGHSRNSANCEYTFPLPVNTRSNNSTNILHSCSGESIFIHLNIFFQLGFASLNRTFHLSAKENILTIAPLYIQCSNTCTWTM